MFELNTSQIDTMANALHLELVGRVINTNSFLVWDNGLNKHFILTQHGYIQSQDYYYTYTFPIENNYRNTRIGLYI